MYLWFYFNSHHHYRGHLLIHRHPAQTRKVIMNFSCDLSHSYLWNQLHLRTRLETRGKSRVGTQIRSLYCKMKTWQLLLNCLGLAVMATSMHKRALWGPLTLGPRNGGRDGHTFPGFMHSVQWYNGKKERNLKLHVPLTPLECTAAPVYSCEPLNPLAVKVEELYTYAVRP